MFRAKAHQNDEFIEAAQVDLIFSHPSMKDGEGSPDVLTITTGMDKVGWSYNLNTRKYQTYGGEVIQILSANVGTLRIQGTCRDYEDLDRIYGWFRRYFFNLRAIHLNDPNAVAQHPVKISYPHRGWEWDVYITKAPDYRIGRDVVAPNWQVEAEFFHPEDKDTLSVEIRNSFISSLTDGIVPDKILRGLEGLYNDPLPNTGGGSIDTVSPDEIANTMGDNFQRMIASWTFGDFGRFAFDATGFDEGRAVTKSSDEWFEEVFGAVGIALDRGLAGVVPGTDGGGGGSLESLSGTITPEQMAAVLVAGGFPAEEEVLTVGVAVAKAESNFKVDADNDICCVGLMQINLLEGAGATYRERTSVGGYSYSDLTTNPVKNAKVAFSLWTSANRRWGDGQGGGNPWQAHGNATYNAFLPEARAAVKRYLENPSAYNGGGSSGGAVEGSVTGTVRQQIVYWALWGVVNTDAIGYGWGQARYPRPRNGTHATGDLEGKPAGTLPFSSDCSAFIGLIYKWSNAPVMPDGGWMCTSYSMENPPAVSVPLAQLQPGDYIVYPNHVEVVIEPGALPKCVSHGQESGPEKRTARSNGRGYRVLPEGTT